MNKSQMHLLVSRSFMNIPFDSVDMQPTPYFVYSLKCLLSRLDEFCCSTFAKWNLISNGFLTAKTLKICFRFNHLFIFLSELWKKFVLI